jgi:hypothetical protein
MAGFSACDVARRPLFPALHAVFSRDNISSRLPSSLLLLDEEVLVDLLLVPLLFLEVRTVLAVPLEALARLFISSSSLSIISILSMWPSFLSFLLLLLFDRLRCRQVCLRGTPELGGTCFFLPISSSHRSSSETLRLLVCRVFVELVARQKFRTYYGGSQRHL